MGLVWLKFLIFRPTVSSERGSLWNSFHKFRTQNKNQISPVFLLQRKLLLKSARRVRAFDDLGAAGAAALRSLVVAAAAGTDTWTSFREVRQPDSKEHVYQNSALKDFQYAIVSYTQLTNSL